MDKEEEKEFVRSITEALAKKRGYADFFGWPVNRNLEEWSIVKSLSESLEKHDKNFIFELRSRGLGNDPPDCEARDLEGKRVGIEVTELVDSEAIVAYKKGKIDDWAEWDKDKLIQRIRRRLEAKDFPDKVKDGPYDKYVLVIHTDEPILDYSFANEWLRDVVFSKPRLIDRAFLLISYDPNLSCYPHIELKFEDG